jgi:cytochrome c-type biogenesis protein CcmH/NrfG
MKTLRLTVLATFCCTAALAAVDLSAAASANANPTQLAAARALFNERSKSAEAQQALETIAAADPKCADAHFFLAQLALRRNDGEKAIAAAEQAVALAPDNAAYQHTLGDAFGSSAQKASIFSQFGLARKCLAAYQRATALAPSNVDFHQSLFDYYRQAPGIAGGGTDKALAEAATIKQLDPLRGRMAFATLYTADKKYDQALAEFAEVLKTSPDDYASLYQVGKLAALSGQFLDRGLASLHRCLELTPPVAPNTPGHAAAQWRIGQILEKKNDPAGARAAYEASLKLDPKFTQAADALIKLK